MCLAEILTFNIGRHCDLYIMTATERRGEGRADYILAANPYIGATVQTVQCAGFTEHTGGGRWYKVRRNRSNANCVQTNGNSMNNCLRQTRCCRAAPAQLLDPAGGQSITPQDARLSVFRILPLLFLTDRGPTDEMSLDRLSSEKFLKWKRFKSFLKFFLLHKSIHSFEYNHICF